MTTTGLIEAFERRVFVPELRAVTSFGDIDVVRLRMLPGQVREDYLKQAPGWRGRSAPTTAASNHPNAPTRSNCGCSAPTGSPSRCPHRTTEALS
jgi:hypothetical protein